VECGWDYLEKGTDPMTEQLKFEVGKHYRSRCGDKWLCAFIQRNGDALLVNAKTERIQHCSSDARSRYCGRENDIVAEWREPWQWTVYVVEFARDHEICATMSPGGRKILARVTVTEGEGL